jgi:hypothetical protein
MQVLSRFVSNTDNIKIVSHNVSHMLIQFLPKLETITLGFTY